MQISVGLFSITLCALFMCACAFEGCTVRYGRRGCRHQVLEGVVVTCDGYGREKAIPTNVPQDTIYLSLVNFRLTTLKRSDFTANIQTVACMSIVNSGITKIEPDAFANMVALQELTLENTNIREDSLEFINTPTFTPTLLTIKGSEFLQKITIQGTENLNGLKTLSLSGNAITTVDKDLFSELHSLEELDLSDNKLTSLDWDELNQLEALNQLFLHGNRFQTIPISMYGVFFAVKELTLSNNPLHCNCKLRWLREFYNMVFDKEVDFDAIECLSPRRRRFGELTIHSFQCTEPREPVLTFHQLDNYRYELNCTSHGDPSPTITFTLPDGRKVITPPSDDLSVLDPMTPQIISKSGAVICEARNTEGYSVHYERLPLPLYSGATGFKTMSYVTIFFSAAFTLVLLVVLYVDVVVL